MSTSEDKSSPAAAEGEQILDCPLFSQEHLNTLSQWPKIYSELAARNLHARPLRRSDFDTGYLELLSQLTEVGVLSRAEFEARFDQMRQINEKDEHYAVVVIEDLTNSKIVGASSLVLEYKFIHNCAMRGRLEDVAVLDTHRGRNIGELVVRIIVELAREHYKCYKLSLDCRDDLKKFYAKNGFTYGSNMLVIRF